MFESGSFSYSVDVLVFFFLHGFPKSFSGPKAMHMAPNEKKAMSAEKITVTVIMKANFLKKVKFPKSKNTPLPKVVMAPLKILTPISLYACLILRSLVSS